MEQALSDVTVLDLGQVIAMPFCTMLLADIGARVIKVESRERGRERMSLGVKRVRDGVEERVPAAQYRERNKLAVTLELKTPKGVELFKELVQHADVVTENFSVGTMERLGPRLRGPQHGEPAARLRLDHRVRPARAVRAPARLRHARPGDQRLHEHHRLPRQPPTRSGQSISDYYAGMLCAFSIVSALHYRQRTGKGQRIDLALLDSLLVALDNLGERYTVGGEVLTRAGNVSFGRLELGRLSDDRRPRGHRGGGEQRGVGAASARSSAAPTSRAIPGSRRRRRAATAATRSPPSSRAGPAARPKAEVVRMLAAAGVPAAPVNNVAEMVADPQVQAREMFVERRPSRLRPAEDDGHARSSCRRRRAACAGWRPCRASTTRRSSSGLLGHSREDLARWREEGVI